ncbi:MAG: hypothetical protein IH853_03585 [Bacteroidetes bacterium]|nr:hypothetical protein [Bacteroidota bacterium]
MIRSLRRTHRWVFVVLAVLIAGLIFVGLKSRPSYPADSIPDGLSGSTDHQNARVEGP